MSIPTPHINAKADAFGKTVLMPGDPLRAKFIAENFFDNPTLVNNVRGVQGYTGYYKGVRISVMASGMGMPSISIYARELYTEYGVANLIRVGSAGALTPAVPLKSVVLAIGAHTDSAMLSQYGLNGSFAPVADYGMLKAAEQAADKLKIGVKVGTVFSTDSFYNEVDNYSVKWARMGALCVEMETAALYTEAARCGKRALAVLTISDNLATGENTTAEERQTGFTDMMKIALDTAVAIDGGAYDL